MTIRVNVCEHSSRRNNASVEPARISVQFNMLSNIRLNKEKTWSVATLVISC